MMHDKKYKASLADKRSARERERFRTNREAILHAAEAVVCRKGMSAASMDEVAAEAGFSKATLYRYVRGKGELVFELLIHFMEDLEVRLKSIASGPGDPSAKLLAVLREIILFQAEKENLSRVFVLDASFLRIMRVVVSEEGKSASQQEQAFLLRLRDARQAVLDVGEDLIREGISAGVFRPLDVNIAVFYLGAVVQGYMHEKYWRETKPELEKDVLNIHAFILRGIQATPPVQA
jgi:AcrR family transcriptional regulator